MASLKRIGEVAAAAGVPTSTVRFYERRGLLPADGRSPSRYRLYGDAALERLRFIRSAQATGFTLEDIAALLDLREEGKAPKGEVQTMIRSRLADVQQRMADLKVVEGMLKASLSECASRGGPCPVIEKLTISAKGA